MPIKAKAIHKWPTWLAAAVILTLTLSPVASAGGYGSRFCVVCGTRGLADALLNVCLFIPLGAALRMRDVRTSTSIALGLLLSTSIELLQFQVVPGRDATIGDVLFNTLGVAAGHVLARFAPFLWYAQGRRAVKLSLGWLSAVLFAISLGGWLLRPALPIALFYGQWTPEFENTAHYGGRVIAARVTDIPMPSRIIWKTPEVRRALLIGEPLEVLFTVGPAPAGLAPIFNIYDALQREIVMLAAEDLNLVVRYRSQASVLRLDQPGLVISNAFKDAPIGETTRMSMRFIDRGVCLEIGEWSACPTGFTAGSVWQLLFATRSSAEKWINPAFLFLVLLPAGFWIISGRQGLLVFGLTVLSMLLLPRLVWLQPTPAVQFVAAFAGLTAGCASRFCAIAFRDHTGVANCARRMKAVNRKSAIPQDG